MQDTNEIMARNISIPRVHTAAYSKKLFVSINMHEEPLLFLDVKKELRMHNSDLVWIRRQPFVPILNFAGPVLGTNIPKKKCGVIPNGPLPEFGIVLRIRLDGIFYERKESMFHYSSMKLS